MHKDPPVKILLREREGRRGKKERSPRGDYTLWSTLARARLVHASGKGFFPLLCSWRTRGCVVAISARRGRLTMQINPDTMWQPIKDRLENRRAFDQPSRMHDCAPAARTRVAGLSVSNAPHAFASVTLPVSFDPFFPHFYLVMKERRKILNVAIEVRNYGHSLRRADPLHSSPIFLSFLLFTRRK